ncbi:MAG TPA: AI-2E family transporter [Syntrophomonas sp.]|nr:AI-2E family transporter [Syntrophomonas sp.]
MVLGFNSKRLSRWLFVLVVVAATIYFLYRVRDITMPFILGGLIAYLLYRPVRFIERQGLGRVWAILLLYMLIIIALGAVLSFALPGMVGELTEMARLIPHYADEAQHMADRLQNLDIPVRLGEIIKDNIARMNKYIYEGLQTFVGGLYSFLGKVLAIIFSPILAFYILTDWDRIRDNFLKLFSPSGRREVEQLFSSMDEVLIEFFKGYLLVAAFVGIMVGLAALLLGVKFPLLLGLLAGVTNLIPYFGAFLGGVPAVAVALTESWQLALYMALAIFVIQQVEGGLITPRVIGDKLGIHPLVIVFALLSGGKLLGIWGMLLAVPLAAVLRVLISWLYLKLVE